MSLIVTPIYLSFLIVLYLTLTLRVIHLRRLFRVGIGSGDRDLLSKAIRVHGNFQEYVPLCILTLLALELMGLHPYILHGMGSVLVLARILHAIGLSNFAGSSFGRFTGSALTYLVLLTGVGGMIYLSC